MHIIIKKGGAVFALRLEPADFRAIRSIVITAAFVLHPATQPALAELQRAVAAQVSTWSPPLGGYEGGAADKPDEAGKVR